MPPSTAEERVDLVRGWLLAGRTAGDIHQVMQRLCGVTLRTSQNYVARARRLIGHESLEEGRLYNLSRSQILRDRLLNRLLRVLDEPRLDLEQVRATAMIVSSAGKLLEGRDHSTRELFDCAADGAETEFVAIAGETVLALTSGDPDQDAPALEDESESPLALSRKPNGLAESAICPNPFAVQEIE